MAFTMKQQSPLKVRKTKKGLALKRWFKEEWKDEDGNVCGSDKKKTKVLFYHGISDELVPSKYAQTSYEFLEQKGIDHFVYKVDWSLKDDFSKD